MSVLEDLLEEASTSIGAKRIFGDPYEKNGVTVIPAARVMGGVGGGNGESSSEDSSARGVTGTGFGAGFGLIGRPAGAFVVKGDDVRWLPAIDVNRMLLGFQVVAIVGLLVIRSVAKTIAKRKAA